MPTIAIGSPRPGRGGAGAWATRAVASSRRASASTVGWSKRSVAGSGAPTSAARRSRISIARSESRPSSESGWSIRRSSGRASRSARAASARTSASRAPGGASRPGRTGSSTGVGADQRKTSARVPSSNPARQAWRWIFPLDVFGIDPRSSRASAWTATSCSVASARAIARTTSSGSNPPAPRSTSATRPRRSSPWSSIAKTATHPGRMSRWASSSVRSRSWGWWLAPRRMTRSLERPQTWTSSPRRKPRSPVRSHGPSPVARWAPKALSVSTSRSK